MYREIIIPFNGFYNSVHDSNLEWGLRSLMDENENLYYRLCDLVSWEDVRYNYTVDYAIEFSLAIRSDLDLDLELDKRKKDIRLISPKYYNFETDRILASVKLGTMKKIFKKVKKEFFQEYLIDNFTSCSGFISHYSNDLDEWSSKDFRKWDHNELGSLLACYLLQEKFSFEYDPPDNCYHLFEYLQDQNSKEKIDRIFKVSQYIYERNQRLWKK